MNSKPVSSFRLFLIWIALISIMLLLLNVAATAMLANWFTSDSRDLFADGGHTPPAMRNQFRFRLPNYSDKAQAKEIFRDLDRLKAIYKPYVGWRLQPYKGKTTTIGPDGERSHGSQISTAGKQSIIRFFGGSTLWGVGVDDSETIPALFNALHPEMVVYNHGQFSYNSRQELALLLNLLSRGVPIGDVLFYDGVNDVAVNCRADTGLNSHNREGQMRKIITEYPELKKLETQGPGLLASLQGVLFGGIKRLFVELKTSHKPKLHTSWAKDHWTCHKDPLKAKMVVATLLQNWSLARELVVNAGGRFYGVLQPVAFFGKPRLDHLDQEIVYWGEELAAQYATIYPLLKAEIAARNLAWTSDASNLFDDQYRYYIDFAHVTANGNRRVAAFVDGLQ